MRFKNKDFKSNSVSFHFSNMDNEIIREEEEMRNVLSAVPPPPFRVGNVLIRQPSEREINAKQIEPWERSCLLGYKSVEEYIWREQYWEANDVDDIRLGEYEMHVYDREEKAFIKWREGRDEAGELERKYQTEAKTNYCRVCKKLQDRVRPWTGRLEIKCFHKGREQ